MGATCFSLFIKFISYFFFFLLAIFLLAMLFRLLSRASFQGIVHGIFLQSLFDNVIWALLKCR